MRSGSIFLQREDDFGSSSTEVFRQRRREASPDPLWNNIAPAAWIEDVYIRHGQVHMPTSRSQLPRESSRERPSAGPPLLLDQLVPHSITAPPPPPPPPPVQAHPAVVGGGLVFLYP